MPRTKGMFFARRSVDSFLLRLRKTRHCGYGPEEREFAVRDQLLEKNCSLELRTKLFEAPNIQLAAAINKARAWETARRQASNIARGEGGQRNNGIQSNDGGQSNFRLLCPS